MFDTAARSSPGLPEQPPAPLPSGPPASVVAVKMHSHASSHVSIDLRETADEMKDPGLWFVNEGFDTSLNQHVRSDVTATSSASIQFSWCPMRASTSLDSWAHWLKDSELCWVQWLRNSLCCHSPGVTGGAFGLIGSLQEADQGDEI